MKKKFLYCALIGALISSFSCKNKISQNECEKEDANLGIVPNIENLSPIKEIDFKSKVNSYAKVQLTSNINHLSDNEKKMLSYLFDAAEIMDDIYWKQTIGNKKAFLSKIKDENAKKFAEINYGPWDRLNNNEAFFEGVGTKPTGANFYPADMTKEEFENFKDSNKTSLYTLIRRNDDGSLRSVWYHEAYEKEIKKAAELIKKAAAICEDEKFKTYLNLRAQALLTDDYYASDIAWMDSKTSKIDFVIGPIENYEDALYGYKAANESFILIKDMEWSKKLERFVALLPELQKQLPGENKYKNEVPGLESDMMVFDAVYYAGDCNAGGKTIAINLPNDEKVQLQKGTRKLQLKNSMKAKFDHMVVPISNILIDETQRKYIKFEAFFENVTFHEVAHGLGIKNTINNKGTVRESIKEQYSALEENKADLMGVWMVSKLYEMKELNQGEVMDNYVTFIASLFRSIRFGTASAHGVANMVRFNYFMEKGALTYNKDKGTYRIEFEKMKSCIEEMVSSILKIQGEGDYNTAKKMNTEQSTLSVQLKADLKKLESANIPVDIVFEKGKNQLGIK